MTQISNYTRYPTEDVQELVDWANQYISGNRKLVLSRLSYHTGTYEGCAAMVERLNYWEQRNATSFDISVEISSPGYLIENYLDITEALTLGLEDKLPAQLVRDIGAKILHAAEKAIRYFSIPWDNVDYTEMPDIRILKNRVMKPRKLTTEERIAKLSDWYGNIEGGELDGVDWGGSSGTRAPTWRWEEKLSAAMHYYEREKEAREKHAPALKALGVEPKPYESFADYLRRVANNLDSKGRI